MPEAGYPIVKGRFKCGLILNDLRISRPLLKIGAVSEGGPNFSKGAARGPDFPHTRSDGDGSQCLHPCRSLHPSGTAQLGGGCVKTQAFNLRVQNLS